MTGNLERWAWAVGAVATLAALAGWALEPHVFAYAWLAAIVVWSAWPLGSMALLMIHTLTGGRWGDTLRPALRLGVCTLPLLLPLIIPVILTMQHLYPWARPGAHLVNSAYLNVSFFTGRGIFYLVAWFGLGALVLRGVRWIAAPGLIVLALSFTFAAIDLTMSLDPTFSSSIYGMLACAGAVLLALSVAVMITAATAARAVLADFGQLLLGLVVLWIYLDFMQLLIVWQSDLASEAPWYIVRMHGIWGLAMAVIAIGHFLLPFAVLLWPQMQRDRRVLVGVSALLVAMEILRSWWTVLPAAPRGLSWLDLACVAGVGGVAAALAMRLQRRPSLALEAAQHG